MVNDGLKGSDLEVYRYLNKLDLSQPVSMKVIADNICYHYITIRRSIRRLRSYGMVRIYPRGRGRAHCYRVNGDNN